MKGGILMNSCSESRLQLWTYYGSTRVHYSFMNIPEKNLLSRVNEGGETLHDGFCVQNIKITVYRSLLSQIAFGLKVHEVSKLLLFQFQFLMNSLWLYASFFMQHVLFSVQQNYGDFDPVPLNIGVIQSSLIWIPFLIHVTWTQAKLICSDSPQFLGTFLFCF